MPKQSSQLTKGTLMISAVTFLAAVAHAQTVPCVQSGGYDICPSLPPTCDDRPCKHLGVPPVMPPDRYLAPVTHPAFVIDKSVGVPWEVDPAELSQLLNSRKYRVVHYDLNPGHATGSGFTIGPAGYFSPTRFTQAPISLADDESVYKVAVYIPDNHGLYSGPNPGKTEQIYIPQLVEVNGVDQAGNITHFTQFRGFNGTRNGHYINVDILIQNGPPAFVKQNASRR